MLASHPSPLRQCRNIGLSPSSLHSADGGVEFCPPFQRGREGHDRLMMPGVTLSVSPSLHEMDVVFVVGKAIAGFVNKFKHVNVPKPSRSSDNLTNCSPDRQWASKKITCNGKTNRFCVGSGLTPDNLKFAATTANGVRPRLVPHDVPNGRTPTLFAAARAAGSPRSRHGAKKAGTIFPTPTQSQRPISRADTAPRMNAAMSQSFEVRQDLIGQCQSERSRSDALPATLFRGLA